MLYITVSAGLCALLGAVSHKIYWSKYEFDDDLPRLLRNALLIHLALIIHFYLFLKVSLTYALLYSVLLESTYIVSLFTSIAIYRLYYHPLHHFDGPSWARLSAWWKVKHIAEEGPAYALVSKLHQKYGDVVRMGPNNLSINSVEALQVIYGSQSPCTKPPSYLIGNLISVQSERDPHRHRVRRAVWDKALGTNASNTFFPRMMEVTELLVQKLREHSSEDISVNDWMHFITFDLMSTFVFSSSWNQLQTGTIHPGIKLASAYLKFAVFGTQVPWLAVSLSKIPHMPEPQSAMMEFASKSLDARMKDTPSVPDAMSHVLEEKDPEAQRFLSRRNLESDVFLIQIAGADTSFSVLVNLCFRLAANLEYQTRLRDEVIPAFTFEDESRETVSVSWTRLSNCGFLSALINETLRLHPPVPSGMPRVVPSHGLSIPIESTSSSRSDRGQKTLEIPGNAVISVPTHLIQRSPRYWVDPESFIPERWTTRPELILDRRAWCPFSIGTYGCAGKYFALMEIRLIIARLVVAFDLSFSDTMSASQQDTWLNDQDDWMTLQPAELKIKFMPREKA